MAPQAVLVGVDLEQGGPLVVRREAGPFAVTAHWVGAAGATDYATIVLYGQIQGGGRVALAECYLDNSATPRTAFLVPALGFDEYTFEVARKANSAAKVKLAVAGSELAAGASGVMVGAYVSGRPSGWAAPTGYVAASASGFLGSQKELRSPPQSNAITTSDTAAQRASQGLWVGTGGNITARLRYDTADVVFKNILSGTYLPGDFVLIKATGTTAADIVGYD